MNENLLPKDSPHQSDNSLPQVGKGVRVRHQGRECFAYRDGQGKGRKYDNGNSLTGEVTILSVLPFLIPD